MHTSPYTPTASSISETSTMAAERREQIEYWVVNSLSECAGLDSQDIDIEQPCTAYGLDSLTGVTLVGDLEIWLNVSLSPTLLWDMPSIDQLVQYLVAALPATLDDATGVNESTPEWATELSLDPETARQLLPHLEQLSDQDVEAMLCQLAA